MHFEVLNLIQTYVIVNLTFSSWLNNPEVGKTAFCIPIGKIVLVLN
jgi:hypothetical protein